MLNSADEYKNKEQTDFWKRTTEEEKKFVVSNTKSNGPNKSDGSKLMYSADEITIVVALYGKGSTIYNAMINGERISQLIKSKIQEKLKYGKAKDELEETLLTRCLKREKTMEVN